MYPCTAAVANRQTGRKDEKDRWTDSEAEGWQAGRKEVDKR